MPKAIAPWALDSGGFTELNLHGRWVTTVDEYIPAVRRYRDEIGMLAWASPMDWMCEPFVLEKTGLTVREHQQRTVDNLVLLRSLAPDLPWVPVLQGWTLEDYLDCIDIYERGGVHLADEPLVGVGSVCRRQNISDIEVIFCALEARGLKLHGFGVKTKGLKKYAHALESADSMSWSYRARLADPMPGCHHGKDGKGSCGNCLVFARAWRERLLKSFPNQQPPLFASSTTGTRRPPEAPRELVLSGTRKPDSVPLDLLDPAWRYA